MSFYDAYNAKLSVTDADPRTYSINNTKRVIQAGIKDSPSYMEVTFNNSLLSVGVQIVDDSKTKELKLLSTLDSNYTSGNYVHWNNETWLTLIVDDMASIYKRGTIKRCISSLKWCDSLGAIKDVYFTEAEYISHNLGLNDGRVITLSDERRSIVVQKNIDTLRIHKQQRFIFEEGRCWRVTGINSLTENLITFELEETLLNESKDNVALRIADYFIHDYSIHISNGNNVNLKPNDTLQLELVIKDHGTITSLPLTYLSSDDSIITVNETGLITAISNGIANIRVSLTNSPDVVDTLDVVVSDAVHSGWTLDISGSDFCKITQVQKFIGTVKNNGVTDTTKLIRWTLYDDSGVQPTTLGVIVSQSGHEVSIRANKKYTGYVKIKGVCYEGTNFTVEDLATFTIEDLSELTVDQLHDAGFISEEVAEYSVEELSVHTIDELFSLGLTTEQLASFTVEDLAMYTVGELANERVLVSAMKRVQIKSLI
ncbi:hypothetical protein BC351_10545 [Paenibacillus ferrarius]|uniref:BIG2 domain-containing protein n=1 Tax=Paenibacillus ferrarius TaxID=1469647 RepID=A0A1V4H8T1_9BACL|nr:hypothetical protein [Paenibacillus ferrarius]OPH47620.1 hypothetical protein BC351_10545 [Paenibacillus ferrarius]